MFQSCIFIQNGIIGDDLIIRQLPPRFHKEGPSENSQALKFQSKGPVNSSDQYTHHVVIKVNSTRNG